jgi:predicted phosphodiesterase
MHILRVGLLSDTHMPYRMRRLPEAVWDALVGVDLILHAGDVDEPPLLGPLRSIAPVHGVRGNIHFQDFSDGGAALPAKIELTLAGLHLVLTHGHRPGVLGFCLRGMTILSQWMGLTNRGSFNQRIARRLVRLYPAADIIVFGHTHQAHVEWIGHTLLVNPGAVCPTRGEEQTVAQIQLGAGKPQVTIIPL